MTRIVGPDQMHYRIDSLGITAEGIRELDLLNKYCIEIQRDGFNVLVPEPAAYVIHKILINEKRSKFGKAEKDMRSVKGVLKQIEKHSTQYSLFLKIISNLTKKERVVFNRVCLKNSIMIDSTIEK